MGEQTFWEKVKEFLGGILFWLFLKVTGMTMEGYWEQIYQQEKEYKKSNNLEL